jgi:hypothetical protein
MKETLDEGGRNCCSYIFLHIFVSNTTNYDLILLLNALEDNRKLVPIVMCPMLRMEPYRYCHVIARLYTGFGLVIGFIETYRTQLQITTTILLTVSLLTTPHKVFSVFTSRCLVAAFNDGRSLSSEFPNCLLCRLANCCWPSPAQLFLTSVPLRSMNKILILS